MNITSKSRYALKIMMDLAYHSRDGTIVRRVDIADRQGIPTDYLDQIMMKLRSGKLVDSVRGRAGGYRLAKSAEDISVWELFTSVEDTLIPVNCIVENQTCGFQTHCISKDAWMEIFMAMQGSLSQITLAGLVERWMRSDHAVPQSTGMRECRGGTRKIRLTSKVASGETLNG
jgi:Rrf2 family protein